MVPTAVLARVTGAALIREMNLALRHPTFYTGLLEQMRQDDPGDFCRVSDLSIANTGIRASIKQYDFCLSPLVLSPWLCLAARMVVVSRRPAQSDITAAIELAIVVHFGQAGREYWIWRAFSARDSNRTHY